MVDDLIASHSSCCDWNLVLTDLRRLRRSLQLSGRRNETDTTSEPSSSVWELFMEHFHRYKDMIQVHLDRKAVDCSDSLETLLRVALCYVSFPAPNECIPWRRKIQIDAFDSWHGSLLKLLLDKEDVPTKCRQMASQILCNTITDCTDTATRLMDWIPPAPSPSTVHSKFFAANATHAAPEVDSSGMNWVDLILASASHRPTLAIVVACLHNCLCALSSSGGRNDLVDPISDSTLLISTLLRQVISAAAIHVDKSGGTADDATEWITLTMSKLCRLGRLPQLYQSIRPGKLSSCVLPEHIVLLHLVRNMIEESRHNFAEEENNEPCIVEMHRFLTELYLTVRDETLLPFDGEVDLRPAAIQLVLDILAESLNADNAVVARIRHIIGTETVFLQTVLLDLAAILDAWYACNKTAFTREQKKLNETDQCRITASVRVVGNLCYQCGHNQDLLRLTSIPYCIPTSDQQNNMCGSSEHMDRNGLHVLLSTTCMSYACFTLREWAVVAIRAALEGCPQNQAIVAELEAQSSMNSSDLENMGIRVDLDASKGKVSVSQMSDET